MINDIKAFLEEPAKFDIITDDKTYSCPAAYMRGAPPQSYKQESLGRVVSEALQGKLRLKAKSDNIKIGTMVFGTDSDGRTYVGWYAGMVTFGGEEYATITVSTSRNIRALEPTWIRAKSHTVRAVQASDLERHP